MQLKLKLNAFVNSKQFEKLITTTILVNCFLIGVEVRFFDKLPKGYKPLKEINFTPQNLEGIT